MNVMHFEEKSIDYERGQQLGGVSILSISLISRHGMGLLEGTVRSRRRRITIAAANFQKSVLKSSSELNAFTGQY